MKDRVRISLTISPEFVALLESKVGETKFRNRSHALEPYLRQALAAKAGQAVILIGDENKVLTDICGETVIEKTLNMLKKAGIKRIILCCKKSANQLREFLSKKIFADFDFIYTENEGNGTAAALYKCKSQLNPENFLLLYGDILAELDIYDFLDFHESSHGVGTIVITSVADPKPWGVVKVKRNSVIEFHEKPKDNVEDRNRLTNLIHAGIYAFKPEIFGYIDNKTKSLETDVIPKLIEDRQLYSYLLDGVWFNISREDLLHHALKYCTPKYRSKKV